MVLQLNEVVQKANASQNIEDYGELSSVTDKVLIVNSGNFCFTVFFASACSVNIII